MRTLLALLTLSGPACQAPIPGPRVLNDDGGWCWFQDERALALGDHIVFGSVAAGRHDPTRRGDIELTAWWPESNEVRRMELHDRLECDDHNAPALLVVEGGKLLAVYAKHGTDKLVRWRSGDADLDADTWNTEGTLTLDERSRVGVTYSNLHRDRERGLLLNLFRGLGWDPNLLHSSDEGEHWEWIGQVLGGPGRPYLNYTSDGRGDVHMIATEQHPRDYDNGLYHGILRGLDVCASDGRVLGQVGEAPPAPSDLTRMFQGRPGAVAWPVDLELDAEGRPVALFSVQTDGAGRPRGSGGLEHSFAHARWMDGKWEHELFAHGGTRLYAGEDDYTGLGALDPADPNSLYISTDAHPASGQPLVSDADGRRHREIFRACRDPGTGQWRFAALTRNSTLDNLRPILPAGSPRVLLWLRGSLTTYTDYDLEVVGLPLDD